MNFNANALISRIVFNINWTAGVKVSHTALAQLSLSLRQSLSQFLSVRHISCDKYCRYSSPYMSGKCRAHKSTADVSI